MHRNRRQSVSQRRQASHLLEDFRLNPRNSQLELSDIVSKVVEFSCDQHGSKFIQRKIMHATEARKAAVFAEVHTRLNVLAFNMFGNYVIQRFLEVGTPDQIAAIVGFIIDECCALSFNLYGCRVVQKAIQIGSAEHQQWILQALQGREIQCAQNVNANHVLQIAFQHVLHRPALTPIVYAFCGHVSDMCKHMYACRVMQRVIEHGTIDQREAIAMEILNNLIHLAQNQYGNYVIQHVLHFCEPHIKSQMIDAIIGNIVYLSQQKYSSNVVEKCLASGDLIQQFGAVERIVISPPQTLFHLCCDPYANYVIQKILEVAMPAQRENFIAKLQPQFGHLVRHVCGQRIVELALDLRMKDETNNN